MTSQNQSNKPRTSVASYLQGNLLQISYYYDYQWWSAFFKLVITWEVVVLQLEWLIQWIGWLLLYPFNMLRWHIRIISIIISVSSGHVLVTTDCQMFIKQNYKIKKFIYSLKQRWTYCDFWFFWINIVRCPWSSVLFPEHQTCTQSSLTQQHHQKHHQEHIHCPATHIEILLTTISKHFTTTANTKQGRVP